MSRDDTEETREVHTQPGNQLIPFDGTIEIRCVKHNGEWWYCIVDIIQCTTDSRDPKQY